MGVVDGAAADTRLGVDVGGTFTDLVTVDGAGRLVFAKVPSVPADQSTGVLAAFVRSGVPAERIARFAHGTTVATNTLLERNGAKTALVTTAGFRDILEIGRQDRPSLYDLTRPRPRPLVPRELRFTLDERMGPHGVVRPLAEADVRRLAGELRAVDGLAAVAVCLLFSFLHPEHEQLAGRILREELPGVTVVLSSEVLARFREYERFATTAASAYLTPRLASYLRSLGHKAAGHGLPEPLIMFSSGGVVPIGVAARTAAACVLSGPAGGVVGAAYVAARSGERNLLTFDMGGTSTDVATVLDGVVQLTHEASVGGVPIHLPSVDVHSVSAGGGSIAWVDDGGALRVGPRSAGALPGPACYGRGGTEPAVTDADLYLGYLPDGATLGGEVVLRRAASEKALARLGERLGLDPLETAAGVVDVANAEMARALRVVTVERGHDPREFALVAFGGAGGMHACALAEELGCRRILVPAACGVLSALGLALGDLRRDYVAAAFLDPEREPDALARQFAALAERALADQPDATLTRFADCRYAGQSFELTVPADDLAAVRERFEEAHAARYGHRSPERPVEVVALRLVATVAGVAPALAAPPADPAAAARRTRRDAWFPDGAGWRPVEVVPRAALGPGEAVTGPAIVEFAEATLVVRPGWDGVVDHVGTLVLERRATA
ncbi:MAG: hydantoinase/oxoprolinase family protein [Frankia sp.]|nr:hydantoinase/oxoprolinase family protein [Frankia sp.]